MQEEELIHGLQKREEEAFRQLVALYKDRLYNTVLSFLQNEAEAEDITQEVFIKVYQSVHQFKSEAKLSTWLYRIAVTQSLDFLRKKKRQKSSFLQNLFAKKEEGLERPDFHHPGIAAEQKETAAVLFIAIKQLPENQQTAFLLQKTEGLSQDEIAGIMNLSIGAIESLLQRAKTTLRKLLEEYYQKHYR